MFKELSGMMNLLNNKGKIQEEMQKFQQTIPQMTTEGNAGGGMVTVKVNGQMHVLSIKLNEDAMKLNDREMLEDLIAAGVNSALTKMKEMVAVETQKMASNMGIPPGMLGGGAGGLLGM